MINDLIKHCTGAHERSDHRYLMTHWPHCDHGPGCQDNLGQWKIDKMGIGECRDWGRYDNMISSIRSFRFRQNSKCKVYFRRIQIYVFLFEKSP